VLPKGKRKFSAAPKATPSNCGEALKLCLPASRGGNALDDAPPGVMTLGYGKNGKDGHNG